MMAKSRRATSGLETPIKDYVQDHICAPNGWDPNRTQLEIPLSGRQSLVRLVTGPEGQRIVLRVFTSKRAIREARRLDALGDLLEANSVPTPRCLRRISNFGGVGAVLVEEEHVEGDNLLTFQRTPETLRAVATTLARLHAVRSPHFGDPLAPRSRGIAKATVKRFKNRLRSLRADIPHRPTRAERQELMAWVRAWYPALRDLPLQSLIHDKLNPHNMLVTPEPRAVLLDIGTVHWGHPAKDMAQLRHESFDGDEAAWQVVFSHHQDLIGPDIAAEIRAFLPLFEVYFMVGEAAIAAKRLQRVRRGKSSAVVKYAPTKIARFWSEAMEIVRSVKPAA